MFPIYKMYSLFVEVLTTVSSFNNVFIIMNTSAWQCRGIVLGYFRGRKYSKLRRPTRNNMRKPVL